MGETRRRRRRYGSSRRRALLVSVLGLSLGVSIFLLIGVAITLGGRVSKLTKANSELNTALFRFEQQVKELEPRVEELEEELRQVVAGRFPNLHPLEPDTVLPVNEQYVKNLVFTVINQGTVKHYEYRVVMENPFDHAVRPHFRVMVFDRLGVQVGVDEINEMEDLNAEESRTYSSRLDLFKTGEPRYFHIDFRMPGEL